MTDYRILYVSLYGEPQPDVIGLLSQTGLGVSLAPVGDAVEMVQVEHYDLLLLDAVFATSEIEEVCTKLRAFFHNPLLVLLDKADESQLVTLYATGVDECILRPTMIRLQFAKIRSWLRWSVKSSDDAVAQSSLLTLL